MKIIEKNPEYSWTRLNRRYFTSLAQMCEEQLIGTAEITQHIMLEQHIQYYMFKNNKPIHHYDGEQCDCYYNTASVVIAFKSGKTNGVYTPLNFPHTNIGMTMDKIIEEMNLFKFVC